MKGNVAVNPSDFLPSSLSVTAMRKSVLLLLQLALLMATAYADQKDNGLEVWKCCRVYEMLSADAMSCVEAPWPRNASLFTDNLNRIVPPLDSEWMQRWLPPGLPLQEISYVKSGCFIRLGAVSSVSSSSLWNHSLPQNEHLSRNTITFFEDDVIARPRPGGGYRRARYCVDAAQPNLGPFAIRVDNFCTEEECAVKCCNKSQLLKNNTGKWRCVRYAEGYWTPTKSAVVLDPEYPVARSGYVEDFGVSPWELRNAHWALNDESIIHFLFSTWHPCLDFYRTSNGGIHEGVFYVKFPRITRGVYRLLRPLCILSALLLLASIVSIACDKNMRRKIHCRCLASHAACLLAFNIGQIGYYFALSDKLDKRSKLLLPLEVKTVCKYVALTMYFLLSAAWFWLAALCANMARGFGMNQTHLNKATGKRFLAISAFAWGLPAVLTITCSILFIPPSRWVKPPWYSPSLMETRVCYVESFSYSSVYWGMISFMKSGTALFYYGPMCCLVVCNVFCLAKTWRKVQYLKRGTSILRLDEELLLLDQTHPGGNNPSTAHSVMGHGKRKRISVDAKTIKLYIKMVLMTGAVELLSEIIMWFITDENFSGVIFGNMSLMYSQRDRDLAYRAAGHVTDLFRAAVVAWLAAPEGGYLGLVRRLLGGKGAKKSARVGDVCSDTTSED